MSCFVVSGAPCALARSQRSDLFEVHVTIGPRRAAELEVFLSLCARRGWKAIVIAIDPQAAQQPMTCSRVTGVPDDAHAHAELVQAELMAAGFAVTRVKIEAAPWNSHVPRDDDERQDQHPSAYFEYHAKLRLPETGWEPLLLPLCARFEAHLSNNALRRDDDGWVDRFVTVRAYRCGLDRFAQHTDQLSRELRAHGFCVVSSVVEYCIYDSNSALDAAWHSAAGASSSL